MWQRPSGSFPQSFSLGHLVSNIYKRLKSGFAWWPHCAEVSEQKNTGSDPSPRIAKTISSSVEEWSVSPYQSPTGHPRKSKRNNFCWPGTPKLWQQAWQSPLQKCKPFEVVIRIWEHLPTRLTISREAGADLESFSHKIIAHLCLHSNHVHDMDCFVLRTSIFTSGNARSRFFKIRMIPFIYRLFPRSSCHVLRYDQGPKTWHSFSSRGCLLLRWQQTALLVLRTANIGSAVTG